jgi:hypothetical protein
VALVTALPPLPARAGALGDFEKSLDDDRDKKEDEKKDHRKKYRDYDDESGFMGELLAIVFVYGGRQSWERVHPSADPEALYLTSRRPGEALIPYFRFDTAVQIGANDDVTALDGRMEAGYGPTGMQVRVTDYRERDPDDDLQLVEVHGLYRMSIGNVAELDFGLGVLFVEGENRHTGVSLTLPFLIHPTPFFGLEFRPTWSRIYDHPVGDYDIGIVAGPRFFSFRAGYRWLATEEEVIDGPYLGFTLTF